MRAEKLVIEYRPPCHGADQGRSASLHCPAGYRIGRILAQIHLRDSGHETHGPDFYVISLGSAPRIGDDRRAIPAAMVQPGRSTGDGPPCLDCLVDREVVQRAPVYVEGLRCHGEPWLDRVRRYFDQASSPPSSPSG